MIDLTVTLRLNKSGKQEIYSRAIQVSL